MRGFGRRNKVSQDEVVTQAEELLCGSAAAGYRRRLSRVPVWAHVNLLAHGSYEDLARTAARAGHGHPSTWDVAVSGLAQDLVRLDLNGTALRVLQHEVLIPLELELLARHQSEPTTPMQLTALVRGALGQHPIGS